MRRASERAGTREHARDVSAIDPLCFVCFVCFVLLYYDPEMRGMPYTGEGGRSWTV